jgi:two-component system OmpR family sensor kinase
MSFVRLDRLVQIVDAQGRAIARSANLGAATLPVHAATLGRVARGETVFETLHDFGEEPTRLVTLPLPAAGASRAIQVAGSLDDVQHVLNAAAVLFAVMSAVLLAAVGAAGARLTRRAFGAIDDVVQKAHRIGEQDLSQRLPHPGTTDEIGRLVDTLNDMLGRIEHGVEVQRRFTADASHELRSPLSRLRTELELALRRPRESSAYVETLRSGLEEVERLSLLVEELLALARIDAGQERDRAERVALNALTREALGRMKAIADARSVRLELEATGQVHARVVTSSVGLVLDNLLDNAIKFSPIDDRVTVQLAVEGGDAVVRVIDHGPGIRRDELLRIFERFYRGPSARAGSTPGMGLGLALSQAIVQADGGSISASNVDRVGTMFEVRLPLVG